MNKADKSETEILRQKAEELLKKKTSGFSLHLSEADTRKLIHELEVHQIELELQNEELMLARSAQQDISDKYTELYDFAPSGYFTLSKEGKIIGLNLCGSNMLCKERSRLINSLFGFFVSNETRSIFNDFLSKVFSSKAIETCEITFATPGNSPMYVYLTGIVTGYGEQCFITAIDITERKEAEAELREKEVQYRNLADSGLALIRTSGADKLFNYFNKPWLEFTGRGLEQEMGNGFTEGVHPDDIDRCLKSYVTAFDNHETFDMEYRLHHVSNEYRWIYEMGKPLYNSKGEFSGYIGHCFDITEHKRVEEALKNEELMAARSAAQDASEKYIELSDLHQRVILHFVKNRNSLSQT